MGSKVPAISELRSVENPCEPTGGGSDGTDDGTAIIARPPRTFRLRSQTVHEVLDDAQVMAAELALVGEERLADQARGRARQARGRVRGRLAGPALQSEATPAGADRPVILELVVSAWLAQADVVHWPEGADSPAVILVAGETLPPRSEWRGIAEAAASVSPDRTPRSTSSSIRLNSGSLASGDPPSSSMRRRGVYNERASPSEAADPRAYPS